MKKLIIFLILFFISQNGFSQWDSCPFDEVDESSPGTCGRYLDTDADSLCDLSQDPPSERIVSVETEGQEESAPNFEPIELDSSYTKKPTYNLNLWAFGLTAAYIFSFLLKREGKITLRTHRKIWNILLTISFLASAILGILLVIRINTGWYIDLPFNMLYWHVEAGIAMTVISIFHIIWHWGYYKNVILKR